MASKNIEQALQGEVDVFRTVDEGERQIPTERLHGLAKIAGARIEYTYETPVDEQDAIDPVPVLLAHGYGGIKTSYRQLRTNLAQMGKPAITYRPARSKGLIADLNPGSLWHGDELPSQAAWAVLRDVRDITGHEMFDLSGHSMGGQTIANVASHKPEHVRSAIFVASVGLDEHNVPQMIRRALAFLPRELAPVAQQAIRKTNARIALESLHYILRNPQRTLLEGLSAAGCDLHEDIKQLRERGIKTAAIQFQNDVFFPLNAAIKDSKHLFDAYHVYPDPASNHLTPQTDPLGVAAAHLHILDELHSKLGLSRAA